MTNETYPRFVRGLDPTNENERGLPCFVRHEDAGRRCERTATMRVYGLAFCGKHGEEVRAGALLEAYEDAGHFFDRFRNPHTPDVSEVIERELLAAVGRMRSEGPSDLDYQNALRRAYPDGPEKMRGMVEEWEAADEPGYQAAVDSLLDMLATTHKLMRLAFEDRQAWLVELLEGERQSVAAKCAYALRDSPRQVEAALERTRERPGGAA